MLNKYAAMSFAAVLSVGLIAGMAAASSPGDLVKARQTAMKANGKSLKALVKIAKGQDTYDAAAVKKLVDGIAAGTDKLWKDGVWDASTQSVTKDNDAKPEIWSDAAGFEAAHQRLLDAATKVAATTDQGSFAKAFPALGEACKGCHEKYRKPEN